MKSIGKIGLKITQATREYYRYTGASAELEIRGAGCSRAELAWVNRSLRQNTRPAPQKAPVSPTAQDQPDANPR